MWRAIDCICGRTGKSVTTKVSLSSDYEIAKKQAAIARGLFLQLLMLAFPIVSIP
jgi:hypothetical protein